MSTSSQCRPYIRATAHRCAPSGRLTLIRLPLSPPGLFVILISTLALDTIHRAHLSLHLPNFGSDCPRWPRSLHAWCIYIYSQVVNGLHIVFLRLQVHAADGLCPARYPCLRNSWPANPMVWNTRLSSTVAVMADQHS